MPLSNYDKIIDEAADEWNLDPRFLKAVLLQENRQGNPRAVSSAGAIGIGQLMPATAKNLGVTNPTDPVQSIYGAAKYLDTALTAEGTPARAALYYHGGPGWRQNYGPESAAYVPGVVKNYAALGSPQPTANNAAAAQPTPASTQPARVQVASATPKTATDATPGGDDPLSLLPPAPKPSSAPAAVPATASAPASTATKGGGTAAPAANDDDPLKLLPPAPKPVNQPPPSSSQDPATYNPIHTAAVNALSWARGLHEDLQPAPGTWYGDVLPVAQTPEEAKAGTSHFAMPNMLRAPLLGLTTPISEAGTVDPVNGTYGADPNMVAGALMLPGAVNPLRFGGSLRFAEAPSAEAVAGINALDPEVLRRAQLRPTLAGSGASEPSGVPPSSQPSPTPMGPQPAGAMVTPTAAAARTPREISADNTMADRQWLNSTQEPGAPDRRILVTGVTPTLAEQEQNVVLSRELKNLRNQSPELSQEERTLLSDNNEKRKEFYHDTFESETQQAQALADAKDKIDTDLKTTWSNKGTADVVPVQKQIAGELSGSAGDLPPMKAAMKQVSDSLENAGADPQQMYRTHRLINYLQSRAGKLENPGYGAADVQAALTRVKGVIADQIDTAAPGFKAAMKDYADVRGPIDAAKELAAREGKGQLYNSKGYFSFPAVHRLMRDIIESRAPGAADSPLKFVSEQQFQRLQALHDDLKRTASAYDLAQAYGSDSAQNFMDIVKGVGKTIGWAGVHAAAAQMFGFAGPFVTDTAKRMVESRAAARAERTMLQRGREILRGGANPPNPLNQPGP